MCPVYISFHPFRCNGKVSRDLMYRKWWLDSCLLFSRYRLIYSSDHLSPFTAPFSLPSPCIRSICDIDSGVEGSIEVVIDSTYIKPVPAGSGGEYGRHKDVHDRVISINEVRVSHLLRVLREICWSH